MALVLWGVDVFPFGGIAVVGLFELLDPGDQLHAALDEALRPALPEVAELKCGPLVGIRNCGCLSRNGWLREAGPLGGSGLVDLGLTPDEYAILNVAWAASIVLFSVTTGRRNTS